MRERIAKAIRESGRRKSEIAELVGVSTAAVTQWESRETKTLKAENLMALARATGRSPQKNVGKRKSNSGWYGLAFIFLIIIFQAQCSKE